MPYRYLFPLQITEKADGISSFYLSFIDIAFPVILHIAIDKRFPPFFSFYSAERRHHLCRCYEFFYRLFFFLSVFALQSLSFVFSRFSNVSFSFRDSLYHTRLFMREMRIDTKRTIFIHTIENAILRHLQAQNLYEPFKSTGMWITLASS